MSVRRPPASHSAMILFLFRHICTDVHEFGFNLQSTYGRLDDDDEKFLADSYQIFLQYFDSVRTRIALN